MKTKPYLHGTVLMLLCAAAVGCTARVAIEAEPWAATVAKLSVGMPRKEVENLLPPHPRSPSTLLASGGSQSIQYWVNENWQVTCVYDYTGVPRDENGDSLHRYSPENKLLTMPRLTRKNMPPPIEVMSIKVRDPSEARNREAPASQ